jgi:hypothetical protein
MRLDRLEEKFMLRQFAAALLFGCLLSLTSGCAVNQATASLVRGADISKAKSFYVVKNGEDSFNVSSLIYANLAKRGFDVTTGPELIPPYKSDMVVTYVDKWMWDLSMYLVDLTIDFRNPANNFPMAIGNSLHSTLTRNTPEEMTDEVLTNIFSAKAR